MLVLQTPRLKLVPLTLAVVEAVMGDRRDEAERLVGARMPRRWPNRELVEGAFSASLDAIRAHPDENLWGDRVVIARGDGGADGRRVVRSLASLEHADYGGERVVGSIIFDGRPGEDGVTEIAYGVDEASQGNGFATEAVRACVTWALAQTPVQAVQASTFPWHRASLRVIEKVGMVRIGVREHETLGELLVFERRRA